ncbi:MAG: NAD(P)(+) transhydrogenase (Re/Si-specific) subunit beta [candidate division NC10 bacterium]|nr:NAD(P)(+) transhydrogenase (Re/Si-specific) subunit beta [candidate division NC10 bacterium]
MSATLIQLTYFIASALFILGLKALGSPETARRGNLFAAAGMFLAIVGTLVHQDIVSYEWIIIGMIIGSAIGGAMAIFMPMTAMPERIALSHAFGGLAAAFVGVSEYYRHGAEMELIKTVPVGFEVIFGALTFTGSLMAFGKLSGWVTQVPVTYKLQNQSNISLFGIALALYLAWLFTPAYPILFYIMLGLAFLIGVLMVLPIGGADMPVVICLLNSYAGLAASATGFVLSNNILIIAGSLDGASGLILSIMMSKAMNRSFTNVLFGAFGAVAETTPGAAASAVGSVNEGTIDDAVTVLRNAQRVIVVPGYGMAVSQAQHALRELADLLDSDGTTVKYAIHPVAGRMPGHMNVLLAEANVPYDQIFDLEDINDEFPKTDAVIVIGANDVVNPAAKTNPSSPIYGMPVLNVEEARTVIVLKRSMSAGFAGIDNELFGLPNTMMVFGDAKQTLTKMVQALKN